MSVFNFWSTYAKILKQLFENSGGGRERRRRSIGWNGTICVPQNLLEEWTFTTSKILVRQCLPSRSSDYTIKGTLYSVYCIRFLAPNIFWRGISLEASVPLKCSYAWSSILQSKEVIQKGATWRIGDDRNISIWNQNWLLEPGGRKVVSPRHDVDLDKVCDLFYPNTKEWNGELLENTFYSWEVDRIRRIYVSNMTHEDCLVWP